MVITCYVLYMNKFTTKTNIKQTHKNNAQKKIYITTKEKIKTFIGIDISISD